MLSRLLMRSKEVGNAELVQQTTDIFLTLPPTLPKEKKCQGVLKQKSADKYTKHVRLWSNIPWYWRVLMGAWGKFHPTEHYAQCTPQHTERPVYHDGLPYLWPSAPLWDRAHGLVTLSNDVPPNPHRAQRVCCRDPVILSRAQWKRETLTLSVDVHLNPGHPKTTTLHAWA